MIARFDFLLLALLFVLPGALTFVLRADLRTLIRRAVVASLPFALTERLFYPDYWSPHFLFDLADRIGFGIEDLLFVAGLAAFTSSAYPAIARRSLEPHAKHEARPYVAGLALIGLSIAAAVLLTWAQIPAIYAAPAVMMVASGLMIVRRVDLLWPALLGGVVSTAVYAAICLLYATILPDVFTRVWHTEGLFHRFFLGIPLEELLYGFSAGIAAAAFFPWAFGERFVPLARSRKLGYSQQLP